MITMSRKEDNFQHLTGVNSLIGPQEFYKKSIDGTLNENDFDFIKRNQSEKSVKGSVRRKIKVLPDMMNIFRCMCYCRIPSKHFSGSLTWRARRRGPLYDLTFFHLTLPGCGCAEPA